MTVRVTKEQDRKTLKELGIERCSACNDKTEFWWGNGCIPLCPDCAKTVTREWCFHYAEVNGLGPLPKR